MPDMAEGGVAVFLAWKYAMISLCRIFEFKELKALTSEAPIGESEKSCTANDYHD
ncbi:hypothetical protein [Massilia sp. ST3]|uniref:hypothetical protein n=1 Tax=Massilia sp. ST3 TaxID=2824903 RepID=UPI001B82A70D|nr:hypothetical protein [Massilia sp. ST3]MBQ5947318.1 hypothetical protein [Massilia sp. ST3]